MNISTSLMTTQNNEHRSDCFSMNIAVPDRIFDMMSLTSHVRNSSPKRSFARRMKCFISLTFFVLRIGNTLRTITTDDIKATLRGLDDKHRVLMHITPLLETNHTTIKI